MAVYKKDDVVMDDGLLMSDSTPQHSRKIYIRIFHIVIINTNTSCRLENYSISFQQFNLVGFLFL